MPVPLYLFRIFHWAFSNLFILVLQTIDPSFEGMPVRSENPPNVVTPSTSHVALQPSSPSLLPTSPPVLSPASAALDFQPSSPDKDHDYELNVSCFLTVYFTAISNNDFVITSIPLSGRAFNFRK